MQIALAVMIMNAEERWPSGRWRTLGKRVGGKLSRGFESHPLRHFVFAFLKTRQRLEGQGDFRGSKPRFPAIAQTLRKSQFQDQSAVQMRAALSPVIPLACRKALAVPELLNKNTNLET